MMLRTSAPSQLRTVGSRLEAGSELASREGIRAIARSAGFHEGPQRVPECEAAKRDPFDRRLLGAAEFDEVLQANCFDRRGGKIDIGGGVEIEHVGCAIEEPLAGGVEFLEDVLNEAVFFVRRCGAIALPAADEGELAVGVFAGDEVAEIAPEGGVHGMHKAAGGVGPGRNALRADGVGGVAVEDQDAGVVVGISRQDLPLAVGEQLIGGQIGRRGGLEDAVFVGRPVWRELFSAADDNRLSLICLPDDRRIFRSGILWGEHERLGQIINSAGEMNRNRGRRPVCASGVLRCGERFERSIVAPRVGVIAGGADVQVAGPDRGGDRKQGQCQE
jgi:hypothetical protein